MGGYSAALKSNGIVVEQGAIIALHYKPENNPTLRGHVTWICRDDLDRYEREFIELARQFNREHRDDDFVANCRV